MIPIMNRPSDTRLLAMVQYIRSLGLQVTGPDIDLRSGEQNYGCMDFTPRQVVAYRKLKEAKMLHPLKPVDDLLAENQPITTKL